MCTNILEINVHKNTKNKSQALIEDCYLIQAVQTNSGISDAQILSGLYTSIRQHYKYQLLVHQNAGIYV